MRSSLVLLVCLAVLLSLFLPAIEAAAARRRGKAGRRGAVSSSNRGRQQGRRGRARAQARRGRQDADAAVADPNAVDAESELPNGCDSLTEIGNFMVYPKLLMWCIEVGEIDPESLGLYKPLLAALEAAVAAAAEEEEE
eukprot:GFUD01079081.1.p1 GENE.GFUD01079081.1~~GFUD01079081.1.p1  ORF type:complete len:152 (+),score=59.31 GFUD01079081.1:42-458(+)